MVDISRIDKKKDRCGNRGERTITHRFCERLVVKLHDMEPEDVGEKLVTTELS